MRSTLRRLVTCALLIALMGNLPARASVGFKSLGTDATGDASGSAPDLTKVAVTTADGELIVRLYVADMVRIGALPSSDFSWAFSVDGYKRSCCRLVAEIESV